jgi:hypothetical protein
LLLGERRGVKKRGRGVKERKVRTGDIAAQVKELLVVA